MKFLHVDPTAKAVRPVEGEHPHAAVPALALVNVDHGTVVRGYDGGVGIFVYEYGLRDGDGPYFILNGQLYAGDAVLYAFDEAGETMDMPDLDFKPTWLADKGEVELAIAAGLVQRPETRVNGAVIWSRS